MILLGSEGGVGGCQVDLARKGLGKQREQRGDRYVSKRKLSALKIPKWVLHVWILRHR